jgi:hypothetical protein
MGAFSVPPDANTPALFMLKTDRQLDDLFEFRRSLREKGKA